MFAFTDTHLLMNRFVCVGNHVSIGMPVGVPLSICDASCHIGSNIVEGIQIKQGEGDLTGACLLLLLAPLFGVFIGGRLAPLHRIHREVLPSAWALQHLRTQQAPQQCCIRNIRATIWKIMQSVPAKVLHQFRRTVTQ